MILGLDHISIIVKSEESITFYKNLGFKEKSREERSNDIIAFLEGYHFVLEIFIDPKHPPRVTYPEALGLRHFALKVDDVEKTIQELNLECEPIRIKDGKHYTFFKDPDDLPIELHE